MQYKRFTATLPELTGQAGTHRTQRKEKRQKSGLFLGFLECSDRLPVRANTQTGVTVYHAKGTRLSPDDDPVISV